MTAPGIDTDRTGPADDEHAWVEICSWDWMLPERGVAALVEGEQVAVFRLHDEQVRCIANRDPFSGAHVLARGIVGTRLGVDVVASPLYKQHFDLATGLCQEDPTRRVDIHDACVRDGRVMVRLRDAQSPHGATDAPPAADAAPATEATA